MVTIILIVCEMETRALHKTLVHANRLKAYNESHKSHELRIRTMRKRNRLKAYNESHKSHELTENKNNEKEEQA